MIPASWSAPVRREVALVKKHDPAEVLAEVYDGGLPEAKQEAVEEVEATTEESEPVPRKESCFYSQNGAGLIRMSEFGYVKKSWSGQDTRRVNRTNQRLRAWKRVLR